MIEFIAISSAALFLVILITYVLLNSKINSTEHKMNEQLKFVEKEVIDARRGMRSEFMDRGAFEVEKGDLEHRFYSIQDDVAKMRENIDKNKGKAKEDGKQVREATRTLKKLEKKLERLEKKKETGLPKKSRSARKKKMEKTRTKRKKK